MNELLILIESAGMAWWGSLVVIAVAAVFLIVLDRPSVPLADRRQRMEKARKVA